jgi:hypothetical protein
MKQSTLKKEFSQSTVQRMRNIITGNAGDRTQIQSGFEKKKTDYFEGDVWEENGKKWIIKNGIKQTITKLDVVKKMSLFPIACPTCKKHMKSNDVNRKMYRIHQMCLNCVTERDTQMKLSGEWKTYQSEIMNANKNATFQDFEIALESWMKENNTFVTETGDVEDWSNVDKTKMYEQIKSYIDKAKNTKI